MGYNGFMGQYGVMFWEQLLGYLPKGIQLFPLVDRADREWFTTSSTSPPRRRVEWYMTTCCHLLDG